jgi:hypothetical protein
MKVTQFQVSQANGIEELSAQVTTSQGIHEIVWFRISVEFSGCQPYGDPFLSSLLLSSMALGEDIYIDAPVSSKLLENISTIQNIVTSWFPELRRIQVSCSEVKIYSPYLHQKGVGCFFSGGVDSWYSLLKNLPVVTHLILIHGADISNDNLQAWQTAKTSVEKIAKELNKSLVLVETNFRATSLYVEPSWEILHGSFLGAVGLSVSHLVDKVFIPSTRPYNNLKAWGSHPLLDPLWSTEYLTFIHDGCEADRMEKVQNQVAKSPLALQNLRVCWQNYQRSIEAPNCCECEKCIRTMMELRACGVLEQSPAFHKSLNLHQAQRIVISDNLVRHYLHIIHAAEQRQDWELVKAAQVIIGQSPSLDRLIHLKAKPKLRRLGNRLTKMLK